MTSTGGIEPCRPGRTRRRFQAPADEARRLELLRGQVGKLLLGAEAEQRLRPGATVRVRVDPASPERVLIVTGAPG
ncbi:MAG: hypothetical protein JXB32_25475 [Deltaproteobacteria bacterium]|nr:hypothetical protein [Deltaproteobacteria bacterium]